MQLLFSTQFLEEFFTKSFYREYVELNFDDKIFFHEPINKYYDLLWIRKLAWTNIQRFKKVQNPMSLSQRQLNVLEAEINVLMDSIYTEDRKARMVSLNVEKLALMLQKATLNKVSEALALRVANDEYLDSYMRTLVG